MKKYIAAQDVEVCDLCHQKGFLQSCDVCGREFCLTHEGHVGQTWGFTQICCECAEREDVVAVCRKFAEKLTPIFTARDKVLKRLPAHEADTDKTEGSNECR